MRKLLIFRFKRALVDFWKNHPAIVAPLFSILCIGAAFVPLVAVGFLFSGIEPWLLRVFLVLTLSAPGGAVLAWALFR